MHRSTVDFPEPDGPMMIVTVPVLIRRLASRTARMDPNDLGRWSTTIRASGPVSGLMWGLIAGRSATPKPPLQVLDQERQDKGHRQVQEGQDQEDLVEEKYRRIVQSISQ